MSPANIDEKTAAAATIPPPTTITPLNTGTSRAGSLRLSASSSASSSHSSGKNKTTAVPSRWGSYFDIISATSLTAAAATTPTALRNAAATRADSLSSTSKAAAQGAAAGFYRPRSSNTLSILHANHHQNNSDQTNGIGMSKLRFVKGKLYGRESETQRLLDGLANVAAAAVSSTTEPQSKLSLSSQQQQKSVILVTGSSGVGKSALVNSLRRPVQKMKSSSGGGGIYVEGKYDFQQSGLPYAGITEACRQNCDHFVSERMYHSTDDDEDEDDDNKDDDNANKNDGGSKDNETKQQSTTQSEQIRDELKEALGSSVYTLAKLLPSLLDLVGLQAEGDEEKGNSDIEDIMEDTTTTAAAAATRMGVIGEDAAAAAPPAAAAAAAQHQFNRFRHTLAKLVGVNAARVGAGGSGSSDSTPSSHAETSKRPTTTRVEDAQNRFRNAICRFLGTVARCAPIGIVLDDLQWCDMESFTLLESIINDTRIKGLTIVGCYRSNIDETNLVYKWIRDFDWNRSGVPLTKFELSDMSVEAVNEMLLDILSIDHGEGTEDLALLVHKKTFGNACFVIEYLKLLHEHEFLMFNLGTMSWTWDLEEIERKTGATENVIDILKNKMKSLPLEVCEVLPLAACLGATFSRRNLCVVLDIFQLERGYLRAGLSKEHLGAAGWLDICVDEGFIVPAGDEHYSWVHDKIEEAALELVLASKLDEIMFRVGSILLEHLSPAEIDENVFVVANLLNKGIDDVANIQKAGRIKIARVNLGAGRAATASASFAKAAIYYRAGIQCLPSNHWEKEYQLSLELFSCAAEAEFCSANIVVMEEHCRAVIAQNDRPMTDKFRAYKLLISTIWDRDVTSEESSKMAIHVLGELGCKLPKKGNIFHVLKGIMALKGTVKRLHSDITILHHEMKDEAKIQAMVLLDQLVTMSYCTGTLHLPIAVFKMRKWSVKYGLSVYSPCAFALVGLILMGTLKDFEGARTCAEFALTLIHSNPDYEAAKSRTIFITHCFVLHAFMPTQFCIRQFLKGYEIGFGTGDVESACYNAQMYLEYSLYIGKNLTYLDQDFAMYTNQMLSMNQRRTHLTVSNKWQVTHNLMGNSADPLFLKGDAVDIDEFDAEQADTTEIVSTYQAMIDLAFFMCDDQRGAEFVCRIHEVAAESDLNPGSRHYDMLFAHSGVVCYGAVRKTKNRRYMAHAKKAHKHIREIRKKGNSNLLAFEKLQDAELAACKKRTQAAKKSFKAAIAVAARSGCISHQAIANERFADFMAECGDINEARYRWSTAIVLYTEWGATAKVNQVKGKLDLYGPERSQVLFDES